MLAASTVNQIAYYVSTTTTYVRYYYYGWPAYVADGLIFLGFRGVVEC